VLYINPEMISEDLFHHVTVLRNMTSKWPKTMILRILIILQQIFFKFLLIPRKGSFSFNIHFVLLL